VVAVPLDEPVDRFLVENVVLPVVTRDAQRSEAWPRGFESREMGEQPKGQLIVVGVGAELLDRCVRRHAHEGVSLQDRHGLTSQAFDAS
jgi:hypothetical protein